MSLRDHVHTLLQHIAAELPPGALEGPLALDDNNECFLALEADLLVVLSLEDDISALIVTVPVGPLPDGPARETLLLEMMRGNYCWNLTQGGTLSVDRETGLICLNYLIALPLAVPEQMPEIVNKLISVVKYWRREAAEINEVAAGDAPAMETMMMRA